jgi:hypothetical protein
LQDLDPRAMISDLVESNERITCELPSELLERPDHVQIIRTGVPERYDDVVMSESGERRRTRPHLDDAEVGGWVLLISGPQGQRPHLL